MKKGFINHVKDFEEMVSNSTKKTEISEGSINNIIFKIRKVTLTKLKGNYEPEQCEKQETQFKSYCTIKFGGENRKEYLCNSEVRKEILGYKMH